MLCYVMLCYVMLCYVMLCYVMLCYVKNESHAVLIFDDVGQVINFNVEYISINTKTLHQLQLTSDLCLTSHHDP